MLSQAESGCLLISFWTPRGSSRCFRSFSHVCSPAFGFWQPSFCEAEPRDGQFWHINISVIAMGCHRDTARSSTQVIRTPQTRLRGNHGKSWEILWRCYSAVPGHQRSPAPEGIHGLFMAAWPENYISHLQKCFG